MENTNLKRLAAMCAAAASLSTLGLAGTAMAVETPIDPGGPGHAQRRRP